MKRLARLEGAVARRLPALAGLALLASLAGSCAYYNTFFLARRYYDRGTSGAPYVAEKADAAQTNNFTRSIEFSKKLLANHPKSKWVDDAYLLWARALIGKDDPLQALTMLRDFPTRYPQSPLKDDALFYLAVAGRKARQYPEALAALDDYLTRSGDREMTAYAHLERARLLMMLERPGEAADAATRVIEREKVPELRNLAYTLRAEALLAAGQHERARADYRYLGTRSRTDQERFTYLLEEADCLEAGRLYEEELTLLRDALSHEPEPAAPETTGTVRVAQPLGTGHDRHGRLLIRVGAVHALAGRRESAVQSFRRVIQLFPRTPLAAEAQYRIGFVEETMADDFERARVEYAKVQTQHPSSPFVAQASQRMANLERLARYRETAGPDSLGRKAESGFLLAEQYLFQLEKPERALEEYQKIAAEHAGTPHAAKAMNAQAWVLRQKMKRPAEADSLLWAVVRGYPATEAQLDARDYLERYGHRVPADLIRMPEKPEPPPVDTTLRLTPVPPVDSLGARRRAIASMDSLLQRGLIRGGSEDLLRQSLRDSVRTFPRADTSRTQAPADTTRRLAPADSTRFRRRIEP